MTPRLPIPKLTPDLYRAHHELTQSIKATGFDEPLLHLIFVRVSQINGCAYCIDMHTKDARHLGETEQRLYALNAWRETPFFTPRERAALALAEALTTVSVAHPTDDLFTTAGEHFDDKEIALLVWATATINTWNRIAIAGRTEVGGYQPPA